jgi:hypothetical protein
MSAGSPPTPQNTPFPGAAGAQFADVCKTPAPAGPTPIPYPNTGAGPMATGWETTNAVNRVKLQTTKGVSATKARAFTSTTGDQAGTLKGIVGHTQKGKASFIAPASSKVKVEGKNAVRHIDPMLNKF